MNNYILVKIKGKNINNYIKWLIQKKVDIIKLKVIKYDELDIIVDYKYFDILKKYSPTYKVNIIKKYGKQRIIDVLKNNITIIISFIIAIAFLYYLSNTIFSIQVMYNNEEIVNLINNELAKYDIKKYRRKKDYKYLNKVKEEILENNKDALEWLEIETSGTKYIVRLVERKTAKRNDEFKYQSIVARKDAIITEIRAYSGEKAKQVNEYAKKGDVIISGLLTKPDGSNIYTRATGKVIGETWYKVTIEYPLYYQEEKTTGKSKNVLALYFLNKEIPIFPYKKYKQFKRQGQILIENNFIPIIVTKEKINEVIIKEDIYTTEEAIAKAIDESKKLISKKNKQIIDIKEAQILDKEIMTSKIKLNIFISVLEDITEVIQISKPENQEIVEN